jgi:hypothetical protein
MYQSKKYNILVPIILIESIALFAISIVTIIISSISIHNSNNRNMDYITNNTISNVTVSESDTINYNFIEINLNSTDTSNNTSINIKFITDNNTIVYFELSETIFTCPLLNSTFASNLQFSPSFPSYLKPTPFSQRFYLQNAKGSQSYIGYFTVGTRIDIILDLFNFEVWNSDDEICIIGSFSGSYLLRPP